MWIKAENPIATFGDIAIHASKKKHMSPSTRKRNAHRLNQWKAKRNQAVVDIKVHADGQTDNPKQIDDTTHTDQQSGHYLDHNTSPIPVKYCKRGSSQHRSDLILKAAVDAYQVPQRSRIPEAPEEMYIRT